MYNTSASQFAGGGFMPSQEPAAGAGNSAQKKNYESKDQTLRAMTIKQMYEAASQSMDDQIMLDGKQVTNITILGKIVHVEEQQLMTLYTIDDGTGRALAKYWTPSDDDEYDRQRRAEWRVGAYVRAHGHLSSVGREKSMVAFNLRLITDFNEVTYHFLQCIFQHLHLTKGSGSGPAAGAGAGAGGFPPVKQEQPGGGYGVPAAGGYGAAPAAGGYNPDTGMTAAQEAVLKLMQELMQGPDGQREQGINMNDLASKLSGRCTLAQVREALDFLVNEGHVYSTIDEQHYKTTC